MGWFDIVTPWLKLRTNSHTFGCKSVRNLWICGKAVVICREVFRRGGETSAGK